MTRLIAGCMSGTSLDAIDASLVAVEGTGLGMRATVLRSASYPLQSLGKLLRPIVQQRPRTAGDFARAALLLGMSHMALLKALIGRDKVNLIAVHGQTVYHEARVTLQIINVHPIVAGLNAPVVYDLRGADLAAGGEGAPITPLADHILFRHRSESRAVVNLGGFANFTRLPATRSRGPAALRSIAGGDICACNQVLDTIARLVFRKKYDHAGRRALAGVVRKTAGNSLRKILAAQSRSGRSLGTGDEAVHWVKTHLTSHSGEDLAATACDAIACTLVAALGKCDRIILAGGSVQNAALLAAIAQHAPAPISISDEFGVPLQYRESIAMAVLGALAMDKVPLTLPQVTARRAASAVGGCWAYP